MGIQAKFYLKSTIYSCNIIDDLKRFITGEYNSIDDIVCEKFDKNRSGIIGYYGDVSSFNIYEEGTDYVTFDINGIYLKLSNTGQDSLVLSISEDNINFKDYIVNLNSTILGDKYFYFSCYSNILIINNLYFTNIPSGMETYFPCNSNCIIDFDSLNSNYYTYKWQVPDYYGNIVENGKITFTTNYGNVYKSGILNSSGVYKNYLPNLVWIGYLDTMQTITQDNHIKVFDRDGLNEGNIVEDETDPNNIKQYLVFNKPFLLRIS